MCNSSLIECDNCNQPCDPEIACDLENGMRYCCQCQDQIVVTCGGCDQYFDPEIECYECEECISIDDSYHALDNDYCESCYEDKIRTCEDCEEHILIDDAIETADNYFYCTDCIHNDHRECYGCNEYFHYEDLRYCNACNDNYCEDHFDGGYCEECDYEWCHHCEPCECQRITDRSGSASLYGADLICSYGADPACGFRFYSLDPSGVKNFTWHKRNEADHTQVYFGIELELEFASTQDRNQFLIDSNNYQSRIYSSKHGIFIPKRDSSIDMSRGFEMVYQPHTLSALRRRLELMPSVYMYSHDNFKELCGLHINISRDYASDPAWERFNHAINYFGQYRFGADHVSFWRDQSGRKALYGCSQYKDVSKFTVDPSGVYGEYLSSVLLNDRSGPVRIGSDRVEVRTFRSTFDPDVLLSRVSLCKDLIDFCKLLSSEDYSNLYRNGILLSAFMHYRDHKALSPVYFVTSYGILFVFTSQVQSIKNARLNLFDTPYRDYIDGALFPAGLVFMSDPEIKRLTKECYVQYFERKIQALQNMIDGFNQDHDLETMPRSQRRLANYISE